MAEFHTPRSGSSSMAVRRPQAVEPGPAVGVDEGLQGGGAVGPVGVHAGQRGRAEDGGRRLDLPEQLLGFGEAAVVEVLDLDDVQPALGVAALVGFDGPDGGQAVADPHGLADFGDLHGR